MTISEVQGFHHITAFAKSLKENQQFYIQILGLRLVKQTVHQENFRTPHLFYGDYAGTAGTLLSFFIYPKMGRSYQNDHFYKSITLAIPEGSVLYWKKRLNDFNIPYKSHEHSPMIFIEDPDGLSLILSEVEEHLSKEHVNQASSILQSKQIVRILQVDLSVPNVDKEIDFYRDFLGLKEPSQNLLLFHSTETTERSRMGKGSIDHIAFSVKNESDLMHYKTRAGKLGYTIEKLADRHYFKSLYVLSPSGLRVELATLNPGFTLDETVEQLGNSIITHKPSPNKLEE
ncbi:VOC family protein [Marinilactibacillus sp. Marseille-P9653]|uniref:VOC family protein n=1 Tax=Marinilactibacillus sp. Marseille-P9653 TaxID=2866583 RepID=UPI001CE461A0|nr:VOC family protein [Marinilactibacillus sp. Marseille-P9653]